MTPDYQFKLPKLFSYVVPVTILSVFISVFFLYFPWENKLLSHVLSGASLLIGLGFTGMYLTVKGFTNLEKRIVDRDMLLDSIPWKGSESVLDIGCGNGILLLSAAKKIPDGRAIGIDLWTENSGDNRKDVFLKNAEIEGVENRVTVETEDARSLPYENAIFDVILCGLTMHHILHDKGAEKAIKEMVRVTKPGGYIAVYDVPIAILSTSKLLKKENIEVTKVNSRILIGKKTANKAISANRYRSG